MVTAEGSAHLRHATARSKNRHGTDDATTTTSTYFKSSSPSTVRGQPIRYNGNRAHIPGLLKAHAKWCTRTGRFIHFTKYRGVLVRNLLAVDSPNAAYFVKNPTADPRSVDDPAPPSNERLRVINEKRAIAGKPQLALLNAIPDEMKSTITSSPFHVDLESAAYLQSLVEIFGDAPNMTKLVEKAAGDGYAFRVLLLAESKKATEGDKAVVLTELSECVRNGVSGELTSTSFEEFLIKYEEASMHQQEDQKPKPPQEVQMIATLVFKCAAIREKYALRALVQQPTSLEDAASIVFDCLNSDERAEQLDDLTSGSSKPVLVAAKPAPAAAPAGHLSADTLAIVAAVAAAVADPKKTDSYGKKKPKKEVTPKKKGTPDLPRDSEGRVSKWVEGMQPCKCGVDGGKHLYRECKHGGKPPPAGTAGVVDGVAAAAASMGLEPSELTAQLNAFLAGAQPTVGSAKVAEAARPDATELANVLLAQQLSLSEAAPREHATPHAMSHASRMPCRSPRHPLATRATLRSCSGGATPAASAPSRAVTSARSWTCATSSSARTRTTRTMSRRPR